MNGLRSVSKARVSCERARDASSSCGRRWRILALTGAAVASDVAPWSLGATEQFFDEVERRLTFSAHEDRFRARLSGMIDLEGYVFDRPAPALIDTQSGSLLNPRLALFLDAQAGPRAYFFAQARVDRGFDPSDRDLRLRLDEYALRLSLPGQRDIHFQAGRFATVVGNWTSRHGSWANPFVSAPLVYEGLTGMWDVEALRNLDTLLRWSHVTPGLAPPSLAGEKSLRIPVIWGPSYATGVAMTAEREAWRLAVEVKNASLASRPESWGRFSGYWNDPTWSARLGYRPGAAWDFGMSASAGSYLVPAAMNASTPAADRGEYRQIVLAHDMSYAHRHLQVWAEVYAARFEIPRVGNADTLAYYVEAKYKFAPQLFGAIRWNQQFFGRMRDSTKDVRWGRDAWRADVALGYRLSAHAQVKLQLSHQHGDVDVGTSAALAAAQLTVRF